MAGSARTVGTMNRSACVDCGAPVLHTPIGAPIMHRTPDGLECVAGAIRARQIRAALKANADTLAAQAELAFGSLPWPGFTAQCGYECRRGCDH